MQSDCDDKRDISIHAPREGSDWKPPVERAFIMYFNPRPPRGERLMVRIQIVVVIMISIHAPREGSDSSVCREYPASRYFNPRPPRGERHVARKIKLSHWQFQSTPPARGATRCKYHLGRKENISIHAPREGSDTLMDTYSSQISNNFNPRPPRGERPACNC